MKGSVAVWYLMRINLWSFLDVSMLLHDVRLVLIDKWINIHDSQNEYTNGTLLIFEFDLGSSILIFFAHIDIFTTLYCNPILYRSDTDPIQLRYRSDTAPIHLRYISDTDPIHIRYRCNTDPVQIIYKSDPDTIQIIYDPINFHMTQIRSISDTDPVRIPKIS